MILKKIGFNSVIIAVLFLLNISFVMGSVTGVDFRDSDGLGDSIPPKGAGGTVSLIEFNTILNVLRGIFINDNNTPDNALDNRVGIGTTTPDYKLDVLGSSHIAEQSYIFRIAGNTFPSFDRCGCDTSDTTEDCVEVFGTTDPIDTECYDQLETTSGLTMYNKYKVGKFDLAYMHDGRIGIGTTDPEARLDVNTAIGSGCGAAAIGFAIDATGSHAVGLNYGTDSTGYASFASGHSTKATGWATTALGYQTQANGQQSTAMGYQTQANDQRSTAIGSKIIVEGKNSVGIGLDLTARTIYQDNALAILCGNVGIGTTDPSTGGEQDLKLDVDGAVGAAYYCDEDGNNCIAAGSGGGASAINDLTDGKTDSTSVFLGSGAGVSDDGTDNKNTSVGVGTLHSNTIGRSNVAIGHNTLYSNDTGRSNVAIGDRALYSNTGGGMNVATGYKALNSNTIGFFNVANGYYSMFDNIEGSYNVANGYYALLSNTSGQYNVAVGSYSMGHNTLGDYNVAVGNNSLYRNTTGETNVAIGHRALYSNTEGEMNVAMGESALYSNKVGESNVAIGPYAGYYETGSDKLYIENSASSSPLIGGDFSADTVTINGALTVTENVTVASPTLAGHATTKAYVDSVVGGGGSSQWEDITGGISYSDGKVGIGVTNPGAKFDIKSSKSGIPVFRVTDENGSLLYSVNDTAFYFNGNPIWINSKNFYTKAGMENVYSMEWVNIGGAQSVGSANLQVRGGAIIGKNYVDINFAPSQGMIIEGRVGIGVTGPGEKLEVGGKVKADAFLYSSDENLKKNIQKIPNALGKILQLEGVLFEWKKNDNAGVGLIAQDVEKVLPAIVSTDENTGLKSVQYGNLVAPLIEAVKEQQKQIDELKQEIERLKK